MVRVLSLGNAHASIRSLFTSHEVLVTESPINRDSLLNFLPDVIISFGYRHKVPTEILDTLRIGAFNLHISALPWNGGADPNLWSWLTNTPKGVSLHWMTDKIDRGDLVSQRILEIHPSSTLRDSYRELMQHATLILQKSWKQIISGTVPREPMPMGGSYHFARDKEEHLNALTQGWDTPCRDVLRYGFGAGLWECEK